MWYFIPPARHMAAGWRERCLQPRLPCWWCWCCCGACRPVLSDRPARVLQQGGGKQQQHEEHSRQAATTKEQCIDKRVVSTVGAWRQFANLRMLKLFSQRMAKLRIVQSEIHRSPPNAERHTHLLYPQLLPSTPMRMGLRRVGKRASRENYQGSATFNRKKFE